MSLTPVRMPDYRPEGRRAYKPLRERSEFIPRTGEIMSVDPKVLHDALSVVVASGCAVLFSPTSDGGAISVTIYVGDERHRDYAASAEEFATTLGLVRDAAEAHMINHRQTPLKGALRPAKSA